MWQKSFHLRWNNHLQNLRTLFENLYNEQDFVDVTISCSDGLLHAHKLVLSACSPYFEAVFKENPCKHPTLILKGIRRQEMQTLLEYMYVGSVDVHEDDLEVLLSIANELHVKGLVNKKESETKVTKTKNITKFNKKPLIKEQPPAMKEPVTLWQAELTAKSTDSESSYNIQPNAPPFGAPVVKVEAVNFMEHNNQVTKSLENVTDTVENLPSIVKEEILEEQFDETIEESDDVMETNRSLELCDVSADQEECGILEKNLAVGDDGNIVCHICNRSFQNKPSYRRHMQTHTGEKPHQCSYCDQSFLRLSHLQRHIRVHTGERPYACSQCPKHFSRSDKLKQHLVIHHSGLAGKICKPRGRPRKEVSEQSSSSLYNLGRDFSMYINNVSVSSACSNLNSVCSDVIVNL